MKQRSAMVGVGATALSLCLLVAAGCNKQETPPPVTGPSGGPMGGRPGPGGPGGPGGFRGRGGPMAATATGEEIYQQKCGCHGPGGRGGNAPVLAGTTKSDDDLFKIIHDGKGKMPSFASQLSDDQIKKVIATIKGFK